MRHIGSYQKLLSQFYHAERVRESVSRIYALILCYLIRASRYFSRSYADRVYRAASRTKAKVKKTMDDLEREATNLMREISAASEAGK
jgi:gas vesicle protein